MVSLQDLLNQFEDACYTLEWARERGSDSQIKGAQEMIDSTRTKILEVFG